MVAFLNRSLLGLLGITAALTVLSPDAMASDAFSDQEENFANSEVVSDKELSTMRGGFIDINGMLIDFSFMSRVQVGLDMQSDISIDTSNLALAAITASQIQDLLQPQIIQNMDDNTLISIQQGLDVNIVNSAAFQQQLQMLQHSFQQTL